MKSEHQVCSLELAKRLRALGVKQEARHGDWYWNADDKLTLDVTVGDPWELMPNCSRAFSVAELGEMLPDRFRSCDVNRCKLSGGSTADE